MVELANVAIEILPKKVEGHRYLGEAKVELGQLNEDLTEAIKLI